MHISTFAVEVSMENLVATPAVKKSTRIKANNGNRMREK